MEEPRLNTIDPTISKRWIIEYERVDADEDSAAGRHRNERRTFKDKKKDIADRAEASGLNRKIYLDELFERKMLRKINSRKAGDSEDDREHREQLKTSLGGLPLGDWGVEQMPAQRKNAAAPGTAQDGMTLAEAKAILEKPKGRGRPSAQRVEAERVVEAAKQVDLEEAIATKAMDGAGGEQAAQIADAMGPDDRTEVEEEDLRPPFLRAVN